MKIKRVLFLMPRDSSKYLGGVEKHVRLLKKELQKKGIGVGELSLPHNDKIQAWKYLWDKRKFILSFGVIHIHDIFWWYSPFRFLFFWKPVFITFHGWEGVYPPSESAIFQKRMAAVLCRGSIGVGKYLEKWYGIKVDEVMYGVIDNRDLSRTDLSERGQSSQSARIVFLGRLEEVNGIEMVLKAIQMQRQNLLRTDLSERGQSSQSFQSTLKITFIGDGSYRKKCEKYGTVTGMVKNVNKYLEKADMVIASSYLSIMEAMAIDKPVIAIANNPLKLDYLKCHPMAKKMKIVETANQLANLLRTVLPGIPGKFKGQSSQTWVKEQTPEKLAELYKKLWKKA